MALTGIAQLLINQADTLVPHIEEAAYKYSMRRYTMPQRVRVVSDMTGWNVRKVSEYLLPRRAQELSEDTPIPDTVLSRVRKNEIEPKEVGDRYRISDRRSTTDLEDIVSDTVEALGRSVGTRKESDLIKTALSTFSGGAISVSGDYDLALPIDGQFEFAKRSEMGTLYHIIHPFQARDVMQKLIDISSNSNRNYVENAIAGWNVPSFGGLNVAISDYLPRNIVNQVQLYLTGSGGTFRLQVGSNYEQGENITADITVADDGGGGVDDATTATNIETALNNLDMSSFYSGSGSWSVSVDAAQRYEVTPPSDLFLDAEEELRVAVDYSSNPSLDTQQSFYDQTTNKDGTVTGELGQDIGVAVKEKSATCKSLLFHPDALIYDVRSPMSAYFEEENQGRTLEYSAYEVYGVGGWRTERGMTIETDASSSLAVV